MSAKSRGCAILRYLVLQQLVLVTDILGQTRAPPPPPRPGPLRFGVPPPPHLKQLNPYHTPPPPRTRYRGGASPFNHKNSLNPYQPSSPNLPEFYNHKTNNKYRQSPPPPRRPSPSGIKNYQQPSQRGQDKYATYPQMNRPEQLHEYQQNYYKLQQSQKQFFNQPIKQLYQQQQQQLAYHKEQLKLEEQHAQNSEKTFSRVRFPDAAKTEHKISGYIVTPHPENYDPFTSISTSQYTLNFDRNPFKIGSSETAIHNYRNPQSFLDTKTEKPSFDSQTENHGEETQVPSYRNQSESSQRPTQAPILTSDQLRVFNKLKSTTITGKSPGNRTISTNISLLSNNIDSKHKHLIKFVRNQAGGFKSRKGTSEEQGDPEEMHFPTRRMDLDHFPERMTTRSFSERDHTPSLRPGDIYSVPSSGYLTTRAPSPRFPIRRTHGQPFSFTGQNSPNTNTGLNERRIFRDPPNNVTHLIGLSLNDTGTPHAEALHYYGRLADDEDREELYRMLQNVTLLSDIRKQILDSINSHVVEGIDAEYIDAYPEATEEDDDTYIYASAPRRPDKYPRYRPSPSDYSPEIMIHSELMTEYERNRPHSANLVEISSGHRDCRLRSRRYISDGQCTSPQPITEAVCADSCTMPSYMFNELPDVDDEYIDEPPPRGVQYAGWLRRKNAKRRRARAATNATETPETQDNPDKRDRQDYVDDIDVSDIGPKASSKWSCESGEMAKKRINLLCNDGSLRQYSLKIIVSCRCRRQHYSPYFSDHESDFDNPLPVASVPVRTIIKPVPVPVFPPLGPRGKHRYRKRRYKSKRGHHHHYHNHKPHRYRRPHYHSHPHPHHHHSHGHSHGPPGKKRFKPLSKKHWDQIKKKLRKVVKKHRFKTGIRKSFGGHPPAPGTAEKPSKADRRFG